MAKHEISGARGEIGPDGVERPLSIVLASTTSKDPDCRKLTLTEIYGAYLTALATVSSDSSRHLARDVASRPGIGTLVASVILETKEGQTFEADHVVMDDATGDTPYVVVYPAPIFDEIAAM